MKLIHCADIHLGSKMEAKLPPEKVEPRRREMLAAFYNMVDYARENDIHHVLLSGDIFDSDRPFKKDKEFFYGAVRANPDITFYYLRGNHDTQESHVENNLDNLVTFFPFWHTCRLEGTGISISGIELGDDNMLSAPSTLSLDEGDVNIVMLHGQVLEGERKGCINLAKYRNKGIDYLALGHIHSYSAAKLDDRGIYAYSGCLEGRGFDECGPKGFVIIDITDGVLTHSFHESSIRRIEECTVRVDGATDLYDVVQRVRNATTARSKDLLRVHLEGDIAFDHTDLAKDAKAQLENYYFTVSVKDHTRSPLETQCAEGEVSLRAEFIRTVRAYDSFTVEQQDEIIRMGLRALRGEAP